MQSYFVNIEGPAQADEGLVGFFRDRYLTIAQSVSGIVAVRAFSASIGEIPVFDTKGSPRFQIQLLFNSTIELESALASGSLAEIRQAPVHDCTFSHQLFRLHEHRLPGTGKLAYGKAKQTLAVRFYTKDTPEKTAEFQRAYLDGHAAALASFPGIQRIFCYEPLPLPNAQGIAQADSILGNEVVFDSIEHLNAALSSQAMASVSRHFSSLPRYKGWNTHYPMTLAYEWLSGLKPE